MSSAPVRDEPKRWLDDPGNARKLYYLVWSVCVLLLVAEWVIDKHAETELEHSFGFHGFFGFAAAVVVILAARLFRRVVSRPEDYYDH